MRNTFWGLRLLPAACLAVLIPALASVTVAGAESGSSGPSFNHTLVFNRGLSSARYHVTEATLGASDLHEVVGVTQGVSGSLVVDGDGRVLTAHSLIAIDLRSLETDIAARDEIIRTTTLNTPYYPTSEFYPTSLDDFGPWPSTGDARFGVQGELVLHGVRRPMRLDVVGHFTPVGVTGVASGTVSLTDFGINAPQLGPLVAVQDRVGIEIEFQADMDSRGLVADDASTSAEAIPTS